MAPALRVIVARARAGQWPSMDEYRALLHEGDASPDEAHRLVRWYAETMDAMASHDSGESKVLAALRSFTIPVP